MHYSLGNGCDSCSTVPSLSNINMYSDPNASLVASMVGGGYSGGQYQQSGQQYGSNNNNNNSYVRAGYQATGTESVVQNMGSTQPYYQQGQQGQQGHQGQQGQQAPPTVQQAAVNALAAAKVAEASANAAIAATKTVEGFASAHMPLDAAMGTFDTCECGCGGYNKECNKKWSHVMMKKSLINLLVIIAALACNECFKHFINRSLRMDDTWPYLYILYPVISILTIIVVLLYLRKQ